MDETKIADFMVEWGMVNSACTLLSIVQKLEADNPDPFTQGTIELALGGVKTLMGHLEGRLEKADVVPMPLRDDVSGREGPTGDPTLGTLHPEVYRLRTENDPSN